MNFTLQAQKNAPGAMFSPDQCRGRPPIPPLGGYWSDGADTVLAAGPSCQGVTFAHDRTGMKSSAAKSRLGSGGGPPRAAVRSPSLRHIQPRQQLNGRPFAALRVIHGALTHRHGRRRRGHENDTIEVRLPDLRQVGLDV